MLTLHENYWFLSNYINTRKTIHVLRFVSKTNPSNQLRLKWCDQAADLRRRGHLLPARCYILFSFGLLSKNENLNHCSNTLNNQSSVNKRLNPLTKQSSYLEIWASTVLNKAHTSHFFEYLGKPPAWHTNIKYTLLLSKRKMITFCRFVSKQEKLTLKDIVSWYLKKKNH